MLLTVEDLDAIVQRLLPLLNAQLPPYLLGTQLSYVTSSVNNAGSAQQPLVEANGNRVALLFSVNSAQGFASVGLAGTDVLATGIQLSNQGYTQFLTTQHGTLPQAAWDCYANAANTLFAVIEVIWNAPSGAKK